MIIISQAGRRDRLDISTDGKCFSILAFAGTGGGNVPMIIDDEIYSMANCDHTLTLYGVNVAPTLTSRMGTGGNQVPVFIEKEDVVLNDQGGNSIGIDNVYPTLRAESHGNNPCIVSEKANTLRANAGAIKHMADLEGRTVVQSAYSFDSTASNSMKSKNPNSGCREVNVAKCVDTSDTNPSKNQGSVAIVDSYCIAGNTIDRKIKNGGNGAGFQKDVSYTLNTIDRHAVTGVGIVDDEKAGTMDSNYFKGVRYERWTRESVCV